MSKEVVLNEKMRSLPPQRQDRFENQTRVLLSFLVRLITDTVP